MSEAGSVTEASITRREAARTALVVGSAVAGLELAGCAGPTDSATPTIAEGGTVAVAEVPVGGGVILPAVDAVVTQPRKGEFHGFSATCTHNGCRVATVADGLIRCPCHGSTFDASTGAVREGPAPKPLPTKQVTRSGDRLTVG